jgi:ketosteroid isomerase-like protein
VFATRDPQRVGAVQVRGVFADGDHVVVEQHFEATLAGGGRYENDYRFVFELCDGLIVQVREYVDTRRGAAWFAADAA